MRVKGLDVKMMNAKGGANPALHGQNIGTQRFRQIAGKGCNQRAEKSEDEHPEQHGAFMIAPDTGDLVEKRLLRMGVLDHVKDREIGNDIGVDQSGGCQNDQSEDCKRRWHGHCHQLRITAMRADHRHDGLNNRQRKRQHQSKMADLDTHMQSPRPVICPPIRPFLQAVGKIFGNIVLVMLGKHIISAEQAIGAETPFRHHALPLTEQIRRNAFKHHFHGLDRVGDGKAQLAARAADGTFLDQAAKAETRAGRHVLFSKISRGAEETDILIERRQHQPDRNSQHGQRTANQEKALALSHNTVRAKPPLPLGLRAFCSAVALILCSPHVQSKCGGEALKFGPVFTLKSLHAASQRILRIVAAVEDHIGADQPLPAIDIPAILAKCFIEALNHAFHHRLPISGAERGSRFDIFGARTFRLRLFGARGITKDGNGFLKLAAPRCIRRSLVQKGLKAVSGTIRMAILHFALRKIILRTNIIGAEFGCFLEQLLGLGRNRAAGSSRQSLAQSRIRARFSPAIRMDVR